MTICGVTSAIKLGSIIDQMNILFYERTKQSMIADNIAEKHP